MTSNVDKAKQLIAEKTVNMPKSEKLTLACDKLVRDAAGLDTLEEAIKESNKILDAAKKAPPKKRKIEMMAQQEFSADGPALFMGGKNVLRNDPSGKPKPFKVWQQPAEVLDRTSNRILRLRKPHKPDNSPRATTKVAN